MSEPARATAPARAVSQTIAGGTTGGGEASRRRPGALRLWLLVVFMTVIGLVMYWRGVMPLPAFVAPFGIPWPLLAVAFTAAESWRVYLHFHRSAHSLSLSEIPLVLGLFFVTPWALIPARLIGALVGLGMIRRQPAVKLAFNLSLFVIEASMATMIVHWKVPPGHPVGLAAWLMVLLSVACTGMISAGAVMLAITLSDTAPKWRDVRGGFGLATIGGLGSASVGLQLVAILRGDPAQVLLLVVPVTTMVVAYAAYVREVQSHQRMRSLYQIKDALQPSAPGLSALEGLLRQLCQVFRAEMAEAIVLPEEDGAAVVMTIRGGELSETRSPIDHRVLEEVMSVSVPKVHTRLLRRPSNGEIVEESLAKRDLKDAILTALHVEDRVIGTLLVGGRLSDVKTFDGEDCQLLEALAAQTSMSLEKWRLDDRLNHQAFHDALTGLGNRQLFINRVGHALTRRVVPGRARAAVIFIDLDDFKIVNDSLGHEAGDLLLQAITGRLNGALRPFDTAARLGGDEFAVLLEDVAGPAEALQVANRIVDSLRESFMVRGHEVVMHASVGVAVAGAAQIEPDDFLRQADVAMYRAKELGKDGIELFEESMQREVEDTLQLRAELERAVLRDELVVQYQPIVELATGRMVAVEALVRWPHAERGPVPPDRFISLAESSGLIIELGRHVLRTACAQAQTWMLDYPAANLGISVNVSPRQLMHPRFVDDVRHALAENGLPPALLTLEITESLLVRKTDETTARLQALKDLGLQLSIDDFGTGYSSLGTLKFLPVGSLKIPKPFIDGIADDARDHAFVAAMIGMGRTLGLKLVAEGVETPEQRRELEALHCDLAQGYHFARPLEADCISALLHEETIRRLSLADTVITQTAGASFLALPTARAASGVGISQPGPERALGGWGPWTGMPN